MSNLFINSSMQTCFIMKRFLNAIISASFWRIRRARDVVDDFSTSRIAFIIRINYNQRWDIARKAWLNWVTYHVIRAMRVEKSFHEEATTLSSKWRHNNIIAFAVLEKSNRARMRVCSLSIDRIFDDANSTKTRTSSINHFLDVARTDNIKCARDRWL